MPFDIIFVIKLEKQCMSKSLLTEVHRTPQKKNSEPSFVMNLSVKHSPGNTAADQGAIVGANTFLLTAKSKCQILSMMPEFLFRNCFPF